MSQGAYQSMNLADHVDDDLECVKKNREILSAALNIKQPVWLQQVHGVNVVDALTAEHHCKADAVFSNQVGEVCNVLTADCLPLLFCNKQGSAVAAAHAGWRGLAEGVIEATVDAMQQSNQDIMVWLGPAIGPEKFEVGRDVHDAFVKKDEKSANAFVRLDKEHYLADIYHLARLRLNRMGIEHIYGGGLCTFSDEEKFYSFRKNPVTGRMASLIWIEKSK